VAADLADHAEGVPILRFHLHQPSVLEGCSDEATGGTDAAEAVPGLRHHVLRLRDSERESVRFRTISFSTKAATAQATSASHPVINRTAAPTPNPSISASPMPAFLPSRTTRSRKSSSQPRTESMSEWM